MSTTESKTPTNKSYQHEFDGRTGGVRAAAGAKDDGRIVDVDEAVVRDRDAMGVLVEIAKDLLRAAEGTLGVRDPTLSVEALPAPPRGAIGRVVVEHAGRTPTRRSRPDAG